MKTVLAGLGMAAFTVLMLAQAPAASAAAADGVINDLRAEGYLVQLNQTPTASLTACSVNGVRKLDGGTPPRWSTSSARTAAERSPST
ncbi:hypothetical protein I545_6017 [Mycobacterium kansasii 662]|uniref:Uncharacterized protein n=1 Tax=Mycobacterium kansasii 662 TaxID=1299326 RepID=X7YRF3_MYCKA|nr:hypothetical protein [Mycobacterium kansasii]EUA09694.1 hypothetical protein I545_6017 [Mycobacterium kansasii 662]